MRPTLQLFRPSFSLQGEQEARRALSGAPQARLYEDASIITLGRWMADNSIAPAAPAGEEAHGAQPGAVILDARTRFSRSSAAQLTTQGDSVS